VYISLTPKMINAQSEPYFDANKSEWNEKYFAWAHDAMQRILSDMAVFVCNFWCLYIVQNNVKVLPK
jgi:hypothetical protein